MPDARARPGGLGHRADLDGLRAIAVYLVVAFHAGVALVGGGFVGVDLFFVLSGFLVGGLLLEEVARTGRVDLRRFYARRVRRLLPAALVTVTATAAVLVLVAPLARRLDLVADAQSALLFFANWRFLDQADDYFADVTHSPFLHFWSLSIEEQFYVAAPLLLLALAGLRRRWGPALAVGLGALLLASLGSQLLWARHNPDWAYYGTDARAYQLLAGILAAVWWQHARHDDGGDHRDGRAPRGARWAAAAGLVGLLVVSLGAVDVSPSTRGLMVTVAAVTLILGLVTDDRQPLARLLARPTMSQLGRYSYGTYLWHWPVIAVLGVLLEPGPWVLLALTAVLATSLAALSFHVLEHPVRTARSLARHRTPTLVVGLAASVVTATVAVPAILRENARPVVVSSGASFVPRTGGTVPAGLDYAALRRDRGPGDVYCTPTDTERCVAHRGSGLRVALVGDSQARMLAPTLTALAREQDFTLSLAIVSACPWQPDVVNELLDPDELERCRTARTAFYADLLRDVDVVILAQQARDDGAWTEKLQPVQGTPRTRTVAELAELNLRSMTRTLQTIRAAGARTILLECMIKVPPDQADPLDCLSAAASTAQCQVPIPASPPTSDSFFRTFAIRSPAAVATISLNDLMCPDAPVCQPLLDGWPVWRDPAHYASGTLERERDSVWESLVATGFFTA